MPPVPTSRLVEVAPDVELRIIERRSGELTANPFVLVHGLASNARLWDGCADALAALGHPSVSVDLRGHGLSSKPDDGYDLATVAADVARLIEALELDRPIVAGQSWGGNVVVQLAVDHGAAIGGIVPVDGGTIELQDRFATWEDVSAALRPPPIAGMPGSRMMALMRAGHADWPESGIDGAMANFEMLPDGTIRPWLTLERHMMILRELWLHRPSEQFGRLTVPVMFVPADSGAAAWTHDKEASIDAAMARLSSPGRTIWFRPADHDLHAQFPERLATVLHEATEDGFFS
jgi:pimeloyl-ACP methyl ester carboxylesterase